MKELHHLQMIALGSLLSSDPFCRMSANLRLPVIHELTTPPLCLLSGSKDRLRANRTLGPGKADVRDAGQSGRCILSAQVLQA